MITTEELVFWQDALREALTDAGFAVESMSPDDIAQIALSLAQSSRVSPEYDDPDTQADFDAEEDYDQEALARALTRAATAGTAMGAAVSSGGFAPPQGGVTNIYTNPIAFKTFNSATTNAADRVKQVNKSIKQINKSIKSMNRIAHNKTTR
jgi:hypothetical protein